MKNKLGIFTALILSLMIAGSVFAAPAKISAKKTAVAKVSKAATKRKRKHRRIRKSVKKTTTETMKAPEKNK